MQEELLTEAIEEVDEYCERSGWMNEIYEFCNSWNADSVLQWRGASGFVMEVRMVSVFWCRHRLRLAIIVLLLLTCVYMLICAIQCQGNIQYSMTMCCCHAAKTERDSSVDRESSSV